MYQENGAYRRERENRMSKGTLTTLDFVISVLREHEKDLALLSEKLEVILSSVSGEGVKEDLGEIQSTLNELKQKILVLDQKVTASSDSSIEVLLKQLVSQLSIQNQSLNLLVEAMGGYPTKKEVEELKASISSLNSSIEKLTSKKD